MSDEMNKFELKSGQEESSTFKEKQKSVFAFDEVRIKSSDQSDDDKRAPSASSSKNVDCAKFKGRESLYRIPDNDWSQPSEEEKRKTRDKFVEFRNRRSAQTNFDKGRFKKPYDRQTQRYENRRPPDFKKNPNKYTKYSLKDVDLMNNRSNSQAAFGFLRELDERKREDAEEGVQSGQKIEFKRPTKKSREENSDSSEKDEKKSGVSKTEKSSQMTLSHLMDEEEED